MHSFPPLSLESVMQQLMGFILIVTMIQLQCNCISTDGTVKMLSLQEAVLGLMNHSTPPVYMRGLMPLPMSRMEQRMNIICAMDHTKSAIIAKET